MKRTYLVTGAGSGIGRATAILLAASSPENQLILAGRNVESLKMTQALLTSPEHHQVVKLDVKDPSTISLALKSAAPQLKDLYAVVANAGIGGENRFGDKDRWDEVIGTNLSGTYHLVSELIPHLKNAQHSFKHVIIISSILARMGVPGYTAYCASKAGLLGLMRSWAVELAPKNILVNAICPGWVETEMAKQGIQSFAQTIGAGYEDALKLQMKAVPLKKMSQPEEIASAIAYLTSASQTSITGQAIDINNGALM